MNRAMLSRLPRRTCSSVSTLRVGLIPYSSLWTARTARRQMSPPVEKRREAYSLLLSRGLIRIFINVPANAVTPRS